MRSTYRTLYRAGLTPWNHSTPSGPLVALASRRTPGVALDLGCGTGTDARYLAGLGWQVTAVDYIASAITTARQHDLGGRVTWRVGDVTAPGQVDPDGALAASCDLILDNGCLHGIPAAARLGWAATVNQVAGPHATLLVRAAPPRRGRLGPAGITAEEIAALLGERWFEHACPARDWSDHHLAD